MNKKILSITPLEIGGRIVGYIIGTLLITLFTKNNDERVAIWVCIGGVYILMWSLLLVITEIVKPPLN